MYRPRIIPVLLLKGNVLVKTVQFSKPKYIGDPINAVRIFNESKADELVFLDIHATREKRMMDIEFIQEIAHESDMPFSVGGGIQNLDQIQRILAAGAEKVIIGSAAFTNPELIHEASSTFGASSIAVCMDVKRKLLKGEQVYITNGSLSTGYHPVAYAKKMEEYGAGEIIIQSVDKDGMMNGYDVALIDSICKAVTVPVIGLGGAASAESLKTLYRHTKANGLAAGSMFVFQNNQRGVLINYPDASEKNDIFS